MIEIGKKYEERIRKDAEKKGILNCPFCDGVARDFLRRETFERIDSAVIQCSKCPAEMSSHFDVSSVCDYEDNMKKAKEDVKNLWNNRLG